MLSLREIEIFGFKSFAERTRLPLPGDVIAVVGPNGSGKSNVADAVLWALGEQSAKSLRGQKMQDIIFAGSHRRQGAGMAEVSLVFEEDGGGRVRVGRRLMRSGDSSYLMDGRPVRLKDIHDYLQRNDVSTQGTFLVEQGRVEGMLAASPEERRMILEEVAGIAHYKENRKSALQKLESTQANLLRLNDILSEVETQMVSLKKQASKADRFVKLTDELRHRKRSFLGRSYRLLAGRRDSLSRDLELLKQEVQRRETLQAQADSELEAAKGRLADHETALADLVRGLHARELELERLNGENKRRAEQILSGQGRLRQILQDRTDLERRMAHSAKECERLAGERETLAVEEREAEAEALRAQEALAGAKRSVEAGERGLEAARTEVFRLAQEAATAGAGLQRGADDLARQEERLRRLKRDEEGLVARERDAQEALEDRRAAHLSARAAREEAEEALRGAEEALQGAQRAQEEALATAGAAERVHAASGARLKALAEQGAALQSSAHAFLKEGAPERLTPTLAALTAGAKPRFLPALAAAYGPLLEAHTGASWEGLPEILAELASRRAGVGTFAVDDGWPPQPPAPGGADSAPGFQCWLPEGAGLKAAAARHLPRVALVGTSQDARRFARQFAAPAVSSDGVFVDPLGLVRGGSGGTGGSALLEHERERIRCEEEAGAAQKEAAEAARRADLTRQVLESAKAERLRAGTSAEAARAAEAAQVQNVREAEQAAGRLATSRDLLSGEMAQAEGDRLEMEREKGRLEARLADIRKGQEGAEERLASLDRSLAEGRKAQEEAHGGLTRATSAHAEVSQRSKAKAEEESRAAGQRIELDGLLQRFLRETSDIEGRNATLSAEVTACDRELQALIVAFEEDKGRRVRSQEDLAALQAACQNAEHAAREAREALGEVRTDAVGIESQWATSQVEHRNLLERIAELGGETPEALADAFATEPPIAEEEREPLQKGLLRLEGRIQEIGAVNMLAREEYRELEERHAFLVEQKKDLDEAMASLQETIRKINRTTRERFMEAFAAVQEHFAHLFKEVFDGGEARLSLMDESNPLETGVEIFAQLPGKTLKALSLLSGGEKAKVALAFLFALFKYRPHPFFILDEADAPLDEANINRFNRLLTQFRGQTQFLVISHNKRTMELADVLYGVTMVDGGVSRVVSVRLADAAEEGNGEGGR